MEKEKRSAGVATLMSDKTDWVRNYYKRQRRTLYDNKRVDSSRSYSN